MTVYVTEGERDQAVALGARAITLRGDKRERRRAAGLRDS